MCNPITTSVFKIESSFVLMISDLKKFVAMKHYLLIIFFSLAITQLFAQRTSEIKGKKAAQIFEMLASKNLSYTTHLNKLDSGFLIEFVGDYEINYETKDTFSYFVILCVISPDSICKHVTREAFDKGVYFSGVSSYFHNNPSKVAGLYLTKAGRNGLTSNVLNLISAGVMSYGAYKADGAFVIAGGVGSLIAFFINSNAWTQVINAGESLR